MKFLPLTLIFLVLSSDCALNCFGVELTSSASRERFERDVDQVALSSQDAAISRLNALLKRFSGTRQEPALLAKLAELQGQKSSILFRIAHGRKPENLEPYKTSLKSAISTLSTLIGKYPNSPEIIVAFYSRGKAYEELENKKSAAADYQFLVDHFPDAEQASAAYMSLAEFAIDANNHPLAIKYLREIEKRPEDAHYPFALYKLAWSYYNLKDIAKALSYAEKQIAFYDEKLPKSTEGSGEAPTSDMALRENTLLDVAVFYFDGLEADESTYSLAHALDYFRKLDSGPTLGKIALRFAKLLRSRDREKDLVAWKDGFLAKEKNRPEGLDVILITYEFQQNKRNYPALVDGARDFMKLMQDPISRKVLKIETIAKAQKTILDTAESMQTLIVKNKDSAEAKPMSATLASLYDIFTKVVPDTDPRVPQVHYNLAETLFTIQDYEGATQHYRWITERISSVNAKVLPSVADAPIRAISARYETLRSRKLIPTEVKAVAFADSSVQVDPFLSSWVEWIDAEKRSKTSVWENFAFEANRSLYTQGKIREAAKRMEDFALDRPESTYAIPSASLVLDTLIASSHVAADWDALYEKSERFQKVKEWKTTPFHGKLAEISANALYKKIEGKYQGKMYAEAIHDAEDFLSHYKDSARAFDCLGIAGASALAMGDQEKAMGYLSKLIQTGSSDKKNSVQIADALLSRAKIFESRYELHAAAADYRMYIGLSPASGDDLRRKTLAMAWISSDQKKQGDLKPWLADTNLCVKSLETECEKYKILIQIAGQTPDEDETTAVFDKFRKMDSGEIKTLWAIYALQGAKHLAFRDRNLTLRAIGSGWKDLDSLSKFATLPELTASIQRAFELNRSAMKDVAPLRANEKYITRRVEVIRELENAVAKIMDLPWSRIRANTLNTLASVYQDLAQGLADLPAPKDFSEADLASYQETIRKLVLPFQDKAQEIRSKAFEIASTFSVEDDAMVAIVGPFFSENPSQAKKLKSVAAEASCAVPANLKFVDLSADYIPMIELLRSDKKPATAPASVAVGAAQETANTVFQAWSEALKRGNWAQVAYFLQEAKEKKYFERQELGVMNAVSMTAVGARGEALAELQETQKSSRSAAQTEVGKRVWDTVTLTLAKIRAATYASGQAKELCAQLKPATPVVVAEERVQQ